MLCTGSHSLPDVVQHYRNCKADLFSKARGGAGGQAGAWQVTLKSDTYCGIGDTACYVEGHETDLISAPKQLDLASEPGSDMFGEQTTELMLLLYTMTAPESQSLSQGCLAWHTPSTLALPVHVPDLTTIGYPLCLTLSPGDSVF